MFSFQVRRSWKPQLLPETSDTDPTESSLSEGACSAKRHAPSWRGTLTAGGFALVAAGLSLRFGLAYLRGVAAAEAALETYELYAFGEILAPTETSFGGSLAAALADRAGRGAQRTLADLPSRPSEAAAAEGEALDERLRGELGRALREEQEGLNEEIYALVSSRLRRVRLPSNQKTVVDGFIGSEALSIDVMDCYRVESNLSTGTAVAHLRIMAHAKTLTGHIDVRPRTTGSFYRVALQIHDFWMLATPTVDIDLATHAAASANVARVRLGYASMDASCYGKTSPREKDALCTAVLAKRLAGRKAAALEAFGAKASEEAQATANKLLPLRLPENQAAAADVYRQSRGYLRT